MQQTMERVGRDVGAEGEEFLYGLMAEFEEAEAVIHAGEEARRAGYRRMDAYSPFPVEGLPEALGYRDNWVPLIMLIGALCGSLTGFGLLYYAMVLAYPLNVGGQPLFGWPSYIPITFECTVLFSALSGVIGMLALNGLPMPYHPVFDAPRFELATSSRFFLCIEARDPRFDRAGTRAFLEGLGPVQVSEVQLRK